MRNEGISCETEAKCECRPCPKCEGEGVLPNDWKWIGAITTDVGLFPPWKIPSPCWKWIGAIATDVGYWTPTAFDKCERCDGRGKYTGDCEVPDHDREPGWENAGAAPEDVGSIAWGPESLKALGIEEGE
jgi:hypothetical protein